MKEKIHVAIGFDNNYVMQYGVALLSLCMNTDAIIDIHAIMSENVSDENRTILSNMVKKYGNNIYYYQIDDSIFEKLPETTYINKAAYNRLLIPKMVPNTIDKILYLDGDLITLGSVMPLWNTDLANDIPMAACKDFQGHNVSMHNAINIPMSQPYYNAGVLLLNLRVWRKEKIAEQCLEYVRKEQCMWMDQDALNHVIGDRTLMLHQKYNLQISFMCREESKWGIERLKCKEEIDAAIKDPIIIHYAEKLKPWMEGYKYGDDWQHYKDLSPWKLSPPISNKTTRYIWKEKEALDLDDGTLSDNAPAYFILYINTIHKHPCVIKCVNKLLWAMTKIFK